MDDAPAAPSSPTGQQDAPAPACSRVILHAYAMKESTRLADAMKLLDDYRFIHQRAGVTVPCPATIGKQYLPILTSVDRGLRTR